MTRADPSDGRGRPLRALGRALVIALARLVFGAPRPRPIGEIRRLLVIRTDERVGNLLLTIPLLRALRWGLPDAEITFLHAASKAPLVRGLAYVDRLEPFEKKEFFRSPWRLIAQLRRLRRRRFDVVIEAGHYHAFSLTAALLARVVQGRVVIGHDRGDAGAFFDFPVPQPPDVVQDVQVKLSLLEPLGVKPVGRWLETPLVEDEGARERIDAFLQDRGLSGRPLLIVNPGARKADRRWPPAEYARAASALAEAHGLVPVVIWGPGEEGLAEEVVELVGEGAHLAPPTDLAELAALFHVARLVLTNDTGPMHLAFAAGAPTLAIFLAGDHRRWGHEDPRFEAVPVEPGGPEGAPLEAILRAAERLLEAPAESEVELPVAGG